MEDLESNFDKIYKNNYNKVNRLCLGYSNGDIMLAKDLTQEVFIKVWKNLSSFREESNVSTWIYRITVNTCLIYLRNEKEINTSNKIDNLKAIDEFPQTEDKYLKLKQLYECINSLNKDNKAIILLELEGVPQKEISEVMGLGHEAIRVRIHRIKNQLTKCVKK
ncbi:sigma-70 family RNA polymerase sigma factor [Flavobacteriaceae bacterium AU392]|nr:RNA polymerase sigma factor [Flavobacteriaceae bacterium]RKM84902.1 sigma-70 family RNA polymerase sigma factor [Flavobacteriaceae bacterium AU392]